MAGPTPAPTPDTGLLVRSKLLVPPSGDPQAIAGSLEDQGSFEVTIMTKDGPKKYASVVVQEIPPGTLPPTSAPTKKPATVEASGSEESPATDGGGSTVTSTGSGTAAALDIDIHIRHVLQSSSSMLLPRAPQFAVI